MWRKICFVGIALLGVLLPVSSVSAATPWDSLISTTSTLTVSNGTSNGGGPDYNITTSFAAIMAEKCPAHPDVFGSPPAIEEFSDIIASSTGKWAIRQLHDAANGNGVRISWIDSSSAATDFYYSAPNYYSIRATSSRYVDLKWSNGDFYCYDSGYSYGTIDLGYSPNPGLFSVFISTYPATYPSGYQGSAIPDASTLVDVDGDSLDSIKEQIQGTSDFKLDTDSDGIDDLKESVWFENRENIFCGTSECAYPDPLKKDVYVELDWMNDAATNRLLKPSSVQLAYVQSMFEAKNMNIHIDTGQFGGGGVLTGYMHGLRIDDTSGVVDFGDFKDGGDGVPAHFATNRHYIWKYMVYGYGYIKSGDPNYPDISGNSGIAEVSGDDIFVSGGIVEDTSGLASLDRAVANTMAHEIGHTLCLSPTQIYQEQDGGCVYSGIDNDSYKPENYLSVMNYRYQLTDDDDMGIVDYSDGTNGASDHDDWTGVLAGTGDFNGTQTQLGSKRVFAKNKTMDPDKIVQDIPVVKSSSGGQRKVGSSFLATIQQPLDPPQALGGVAGLSEVTSAMKKSSSNETFTLIGAGGVVVLGAVGGLLWCIRRKS